VSNSSLVRDAYPDPEKSHDLEHVGEITSWAVLPATKLRLYAGCGGRFMGRDLYEVMDWHASLTFFEGDNICGVCACAHGVL
jgi:hypothetical protein